MSTNSKVAVTEERSQEKSSGTCVLFQQTLSIKYLAFVVASDKSRVILIQRNDDISGNIYKASHIALVLPTNIFIHIWAVLLFFLYLVCAAKSVAIRNVLCSHHQQQFV